MVKKKTAKSFKPHMMPKTGKTVRTDLQEHLDLRKRDMVILNLKEK